jgi:ABC-type polysaccharide/polyol phosphate export permease
MFSTVRELIERYELLRMFVYREVQVKYKQSIMGFLWAIFMPMIIISAGITVRYAYSLISGEPLRFGDIAAVSVKSVLWAFIVSSIRSATMSLIGNRNLVTKIYFPRVIFPVSATLSQGVDFVVASIVLAVILALAGIGLSVHLLWLPLLLIIVLCQVLGAAIIVSAASLFFRDVKYLVEAFLTFAIFFTPVFFEVEMFGRHANLLLLNPIAPIMEGVMACVVRHTMPSLGWLGYSGLVGVALLVCGLVVFRKLEPAFAESI